MRFILFLVRPHRQSLNAVDKKQSSQAGMDCIYTYSTIAIDMIQCAKLVKDKYVEAADYYYDVGPFWCSIWGRVVGALCLVWARFQTGALHNWVDEQSRAETREMVMMVENSRSVLYKLLCPGLHTQCLFTFCFHNVIMHGMVCVCVFITLSFIFVVLHTRTLCKARKMKTKKTA